MYGPIVAPRKTSHLVPEGNAWGRHDRVAFQAAREYVVRCPNCSRLMQDSFSLEGRCPTCHRFFTKAQWRDMFVEAHQVTVQGGWTWERLDALKRLPGSGTVTPDNKAKPMSAVAREMSGRMVGLSEQARRQIRAKDLMLESLRNQSYISRRLRQRAI